MAKHVNWTGVFPAVTTQFREDYSLDIEATPRVIEGRLRDGVSRRLPRGPFRPSSSMSSTSLRRLIHPPGKNPRRRGGESGR